MIPADRIPARTAVHRFADLRHQSDTKMVDASTFGESGHRVMEAAERSLRILVSRNQYALFDAEAEAGPGVDDVLAGNGLVTVNAEGTYASVMTGPPTAMSTSPSSPPPTSRGPTRSRSGGSPGTSSRAAGPVSCSPQCSGARCGRHPRGGHMCHRRRD